MNLRQILEMLGYLRAIDEKLGSIMGLMQHALREQHHHAAVAASEKRDGVPESGA
jgi:hypothetical protein